MKKRKWLTAAICSICLCCTLGAAIGVTAIATAKAETDEVVYDILDYSFSSAFLSTEGNTPSLRGAEIAAGANVFSIDDATDYMQGNHGLLLRRKLVSNGQTIKEFMCILAAWIFYLTHGERTDLSSMWIIISADGRG